MPVPMMNIINGGAHANNSLDIQEFMILPVGAPSFREALRYGAEVFHTLKKLLDERGLSTAVGDEGGFAPNLELERGGARASSCRPSTRPATRPARTSTSASTVASSEFFNERPLRARSPRSARFSTRGVHPLPGRPRRQATRSSPSRTAWPRATGTAGRSSPARSARSIQLVGDDLFVTNTRILKEGIDKHIANAILIKPNQIGTLTETLAAIDMADKAHYASVVSHRSGETEDSTIADHRRRHRGHADQDRLAVPLRPHRQVQPAAAHRGGARQGPLRRPRCVPGEESVERDLRAASATSLGCAPMKWLAAALARRADPAAVPDLDLRRRRARARSVCSTPSAAQQKPNASSRERNSRLAAEVRDLKTGMAPRRARPQRSRHDRPQRDLLSGGRPAPAGDTAHARRRTAAARRATCGASCATGSSCRPPVAAAASAPTVRSNTPRSAAAP